MMFSEKENIKITPSTARKLAKFLAKNFDFDINGNVKIGGFVMIVVGEDNTGEFCNRIAVGKFNLEDVFELKKNVDEIEESIRKVIASGS